MNVLQLAHENVAAATLYGIDRNDKYDTHNVIFYNFGAANVEAALVQYSGIRIDSIKYVENIHVLAEASS